MHVNLTYEQFVQELRNWIIKATHLPEDYVFFKKKEKTGITANGDRLFVVCAETDSGKDICGIFQPSEKLGHATDAANFPGFTAEPFFVYSVSAWSAEAREECS